MKIVVHSSSNKIQLFTKVPASPLKWKELDAPGFFYIFLVPFTLASMETHNFVHICTVLKNSKRSPWWLPNQSERLDRLICYSSLTVLSLS